MTRSIFTRQQQLVLGVCTAALFASGCATHLDTSPNLVHTTPHQALSGVSYSLPMLQYDLGFTRTLTACPSDIDLAGFKFTDPSLAFEIEASAEERYVRGESYLVDYTKLSNGLKTSSFSVEYHPSGTVKAINAAAQDQTGEVAKDVVKTLLLAASIASGPAGAAPAVAFVSSSAAKAGAPRIAAVTAPAPEYFQNLLRRSLRQQRIIACNDETAALVKARGEAVAGIGGKARELTALNKRVLDLAAIAALKAMTPREKQELRDAYLTQNRLMGEIAALQKQLAALDGALSADSQQYWPTRFYERDGMDALDKAQITAFASRLAITNATVLDNEMFVNGLQALPLVQRLELRRLYETQLEGYLDKYGAVLKPQPPADGCQGANPDIAGCITASLKIALSLKPLADGMKPCTPLSAGECSRPVTVDDKVRRPVEARDAIVDHGVFVREPGMANLVVCRGQEICPDGAGSLVDVDVAVAPQFGQLRFLPFTNKTFQSNALTLLVREDGTIEKIEYKQDKAPAQVGAAAAADVAGQVDKYIRDRRKEEEEAQAAANKESVESLQRQIDILEKQAKLNGLRASDPDKAVKEETARLETQTALLNARLAQKKAEEALAGDKP